MKNNNSFSFLFFYFLSPSSSLSGTLLRDVNEGNRRNHSTSHGLSIRPTDYRTPKKKSMLDGCMSDRVVLRRFLIPSFSIGPTTISSQDIPFFSLKRSLLRPVRRKEKEPVIGHFLRPLSVSSQLKSHEREG